MHSDSYNTCTHTHARTHKHRKKIMIYARAGWVGARAPHELLQHRQGKTPASLADWSPPWGGSTCPRIHSFFCIHTTGAHACTRIKGTSACIQTLYHLLAYTQNEKRFAFTQKAMAGVACLSWLLIFTHLYSRNGEIIPSTAQIHSVNRARAHPRKKHSHNTLLLLLLLLLLLHLRRLPLLTANFH